MLEGGRLKIAGEWQKAKGQGVARFIAKNKY
jgi:hypothetical protein